MSSTVLFVFAVVLALANLPPVISWGERAYILQQRMECKGGKIYDIENVQQIEQCKNACREFGDQCMAVNLFQVGEFDFKCEILSSIYAQVPAQGAACYYANDAYQPYGLGGAGWGGWGQYGRR